MKTTIDATCRIRVKFSEIDSMRRVWHGSYIAYFEDGREDFGRRYPGIGYYDMQRAGIYAPVYEISAKYVGPLLLNDIAIVTTRYVYKPGARLDFVYEVRRAEDGVLCAEGKSTQLFIDAEGNLMVDKPAYYEEWQRRYLDME